MAVARKGTPIVAVLAVAAGAFALALTVAARGSGPQAAEASSHREAPLISEDPVADNTDVYAFRSPDTPNTVTIMANYIPLEEPAGGPNFNAVGEQRVFRLNLDKPGRGGEGNPLQVPFPNQTRNPDTFLYNTGP